MKKTSKKMRKSAKNAKPPSGLDGPRGPSGAYSCEENTRSILDIPFNHARGGTPAYCLRFANPAEATWRLEARGPQAQANRRWSRGNCYGQFLGKRNGRIFNWWLHCSNLPWKSGLKFERLYFSSDSFTQQPSLDMWPEVCKYVLLLWQASLNKYVWYLHFWLSEWSHQTKFIKKRFRNLSSWTRTGMGTVICISIIFKSFWNAFGVQNSSPTHQNSLLLVLLSSKMAPKSTKMESEIVKNP